jgi:thioredoxin 1
LTPFSFITKMLLSVGKEFRRPILQSFANGYLGKDKVMAGNIIELTDADFDEVVHNSDVPVLVDFWAPWCGPCKMMAPILKEIADDYAGKAKICKLDTDDARDSAMEFGINAIPTIILFEDGQVQKKWVGLTSKKVLAAAIDELL